MANIYSRYNITTYPAIYDHLYKKVVNGGNIEYEDETGAKLSTNTDNAAAYLTMWENKKDLVKAEHVIVLQDMLFSLQRVLGVNPHYSSMATVPDPNDPNKTIPGTSLTTISARLKAIETLMPDDTHIGSIVNNHIHGKNGLKAVSLTSADGEIAGKLSVNNIITDVTNVNAINAANLFYGQNVSIKTAIDGKLSTTGGTISGALDITGKTKVTASMSSRIFADISVSDFTIGTGGLSGNKTGMYGDSCIYNKYNNQSLGEVELFKTRFDSLKYGKYTAGLRVYFNLPAGATMPSETTTVFTIKVGTSGQGIQKTIKVTGSQISDQAYFNGRFRMFYTTFDLGNTIGDVKDAIITVTYPSSTAYNIACDGIVIVPAHTAIL